MKKIFFIVILIFISFSVKSQYCNYDSNLNQFIKEWIGKPYKLGGKTKKGIDCSNFVRVCYDKVYNLSLTGTAKYQYKKTIRIDRDMILVGDVLFFRSKISPSGWHCGIYIGDNKFVHAANRSEGVKISRLDELRYKNNYIGAGRL